MRDKLVCFLLTGILFTGCNSPGDEIKKSFDKVNGSLKESNTVLTISIHEIYDNIDVERINNEQLALFADSIYLSASKALSFIDSLKHLLELNVAGGENLGVVDKILLNRSRENRLRKMLADLNEHINSYFQSKEKQQRVDGLLGLVNDIANDDKWVGKYFRNAPTVAAITILSKFQNDCIDAAMTTLNDIKHRISKNATTTDRF